MVAIHEFSKIVPVRTSLGYGTLLYVESAGGFANDIFAVVLERTGEIKHMRSDQLVILRNPTLDIENSEDPNE